MRDDLSFCGLSRKNLSNSNLRLLQLYLIFTARKASFHSLSRIFHASFTRNLRMMEGSAGITGRLMASTVEGGAAEP
jgi:hypothetical protein